MSVGLIIIIIFVVALVVGPVMMMRPNPVQKNKEKLRSLARTKGVHYSMRNIPQQADEQFAPSAVPVYFFPPAETQNDAGWLLVRSRYEHDINFLGWWVWQGETRASPAEQAVLSRCLPKLPESIRAVGAGGKGASVYWEEKGGEEVLEQVLDLLETLRAA